MLKKDKKLYLQNIEKIKLPTMKKTNIYLLAFAAMLFISLQSCKKDETDPEITLKGTNPTVISLGGTYTEAGATASDNEDGDISSDISISGTVNPNIVNEYSITYQVSDKAGNKTTLVRAVQVKANPLIGNYNVTGNPLSPFQVEVQATSTYNRMVVRKFNNFPSNVLFYINVGNTIAIDYKLYSDNNFRYQVKDGIGYYSKKSDNTFSIDSVRYTLDKRPMTDLNTPNETTIRENWSK